MQKKEIRAAPNKIELVNEKRTIVGYAVKWNQLSHTLGGLFQERFIKGAFADSLRNNTQKMLWSHDDKMVLASTVNNTLRLIEDDVGLRFEADLSDTTWGNDAYISIKRGDVDGVSFGFQAESDNWEEGNNGIVIRTVYKSTLFEISPTAFPAYPQSVVDVRSITENYEHYKKQLNLRKQLLLKTYF